MISEGWSAGGGVPRILFGLWTAMAYVTEG